ncbi:MAG: sensor domain-containing diguanylate cyclase [Azonexus sp.]|nr:sensor domain-containing diguanylate cyclase [Azonexus sp.]
MDKHRLIVSLALLLGIGFIGTSLASYFVSQNAIRESIIATELPLTSSHIYSEMQKDLIRPILISSMMAHDTFLCDWVTSGEKSPEQIEEYLQAVKSSNDDKGGIVTFFGSEKSRLHYHSGRSILRKLNPDESRDAWYFRTRNLREPYEINFDPDFDNRGALTIFVNYRVLDKNGALIGVTGVGLTENTMQQLINDFQTRYQSHVYFTDAGGKVILSAKDSGMMGKNIREATGMDVRATHEQAQRDGVLRYKKDGRLHFLNVWFIPELNWYLFVEKMDDAALFATRETLYVNLAISLVVTVLVLLLTNMVIGRYQRRLEEMAATDTLSGLPNRRVFDLMAQQVIDGARRTGEPLSIMLLDIDHFKRINDRYGHLAGDETIRKIADTLKKMLRHSDILSRWGGEEYVVLFKGCELDYALILTEKFRAAIEARDFSYSGQHIALTVSCGVAQYDQKETLSQWFDRADHALYQAKQAGRNRVCVAAKWVA